MRKLVGILCILTVALGMSMTALAAGSITVTGTANVTDVSSGGASLGTGAVTFEDFDRSKYPGLDLTLPQIMGDRYRDDMHLISLKEINLKDNYGQYHPSITGMPIVVTFDIRGVAREITPGMTVWLVHYINGEWKLSSYTVGDDYSIQVPLDKFSLVGFVGMVASTGGTDSGTDKAPSRGPAGAAPSGTTNSTAQGMSPKTGEVNTAYLAYLLGACALVGLVVMKRKRA